MPNRYHPFQNRPADFPLVGAGPNFCPQNSFGRYRYVQKAQNQLYNFRKSGFPEFPDPVSASGFNKKSGQFNAGSGNTFKFWVGGTQVKLGPFQLCSNQSINSERCRSFFFQTGDVYYKNIRIRLFFAILYMHIKLCSSST